MKQYLTPSMAEALKPCQEIELAYDDFNEGRFRYRHYETFRSGAFPSGVRCRGLFGCDRTCSHEGVLYQHDGPHRDGTFGPVMCRGSGAERVYIVNNT